MDIGHTYKIIRSHMRILAGLNPAPAGMSSKKLTPGSTSMIASKLTESLAGLIVNFQ
jgi:hypothetical protein